MTKSAEPIIILHVKNTLQGGVAGRTIFSEMFQISGCGWLQGYIRGLKGVLGYPSSGDHLGGGEHQPG